MRLAFDPAVASAPFAPLSEVAPRCAAVHHGGIGTTVTLLRAGLPQLVVPRGFDQPQTAERLRRLGVAVTLPWARATPAALERRLAELLATPAYGQRAASVAASVRDEDGLRRATDEIERLLT